MKMIRNSVLICLLVFNFSIIAFGASKPNNLEPRSDDPFYPTQADMLNYSSNRLAKLDKLYNDVCNKIIQNFKSDKNFVEAFQKDRTEFLKYRAIQRDVILPAFDNDPTAYGTNYELHSESYLLDLTNAKIKSLKNVVNDYCLYNDFAQPEAVCSPERIESLFKI